MPRPDQTPRLPKFPFLAGDAALLATAAYLAATAHHPLATAPLLAVAGCVALGAILAVIPFLTDYARKQDEALDERQRALEALGATVTASAEQIGIAANGVHEIAELVQKNLRTADQLPHKLQEKIGEFTAQLTNARADETEELEKSLAELRASESERLAATAEKISKTAVDLAKLEASAHQHLAAAHEALAQLATSSGRHFSELSTATAAAIARAQTAASTALDEKLAAADLVLSTARIAILAELEAKLTAITTALAAAPVPAPLPPPSSAPAPTVAPPAPPPLAPQPTPPAEISPAAETSPPTPDTPEPPSPRKRAPKKSPTVPTADPFALPLLETPAEPAPSPVPASASPTDEFVQFSPEELPPPAPPPAPPAHAPENAPTESTAPAVSSITADGATRLLVTAYIGIGNRLFIRGDGPGLTWEKGTPLQFISIGKWRWETADATAPIAYKLYKNDTLECASLGGQTLPPGSQQEVTATF